MNQFELGTAGFADAEPPLSPETIGRAPSIYDATPLRAVPQVFSTAVPAAPPAPVAEAAPVTPAAPVLEIAPAAAPVAEASPQTLRVVARLIDGEQVELGSFGDRGSALDRARELVRLVGDAERGGSWPELAERYVRPSSIVSFDVLAGTR